MPTAFSLTAPRVTEEDERRELEELCDEELLALHEDVHGVQKSERGNVVIPAHVYDEGVRLVQETINSMESSKTRAFDRAMETCPELVERESPARAYLQTTKFDVWNSAEKIVEYWTSRLSLFGSERAFLPMTLSGAMAEDVEILENGFMMSVEDDKNGRPVVFYDRTRFTTHDKAYRQKILRGFFYLEQTRLERVGRAGGYVVLINARGFDVYKHYDRIFTKKVLAINATFPGHPQAIHICLGDGLLNLVLPAYKHLYGKHMRMRFVLHTGSSIGVLGSLSSYGLSKSHVDAVFGEASGKRKSAKEWLAKRREIEQQE